MKKNKAYRAELRAQRKKFKKTLLNLLIIIGMLIFFSNPVHAEIQNKIKEIIKIIAKIELSYLSNKCTISKREQTRVDGLILSHLKKIRQIAFKSKKDVK